jgi:hypothetical protein
MDRPLRDDDDVPSLAMNGTTIKNTEYRGRGDKNKTAGGGRVNGK